MRRSGPRREPQGPSRTNLVPTRAPFGLGFSPRRVRASRCRRLLENPREAHLSAAPQEPSQDPRLPRPHEDRQWPSRDQQPSPQRPLAPGRQHLQEVSGSAVPSGALGSTGERRSMRLPPADRLRKRFEFRRVRDEGRRVHTRSFVLLVARSERHEPRLGITVSRQVGHAVRRNRVKRLVREAFRQHRSLFPARADVVLIAKSHCSIAHLSDVVRELEQASSALRMAAGKLPRRAGERT
jgi:ribonuclease P protein component